jgi:hypothetical protein
MRVKVQFESPLPLIRSWYSIEESEAKHSTINNLLSCIAFDFNVSIFNACISLDGFPLPLSSYTKSLVREGDLLVITGQHTELQQNKRKVEEEMTPAKIRVAYS